MQLLDRPAQLTIETENTDALIKEARRLRRRRWFIGGLSAAGVGGAAVLIVAITMSTSGTPSAVHAGASAGVLPNGPLATLHLAGPLAVAPDGALYVADDPNAINQPEDRMLVRLSDGRFRVIAGTGKRGFSGDGGPAVKAELSDVTDLAVGPNGTLYIADGGRGEPSAATGSSARSPATVDPREQSPTAPRHFQQRSAHGCRSRSARPVSSTSQPARGVRLRSCD